jgi:hypothetical protein
MPFRNLDGVAAPFVGQQMPYLPDAPAREFA